MFQDSLVSYAFQIGVLGQPFLWMWLHDSRFNFPEAFKRVFYVGCAAAIFLVSLTRFTVGFYRTHILLQYLVMIPSAVYLFSQRRNFKEAVCLGFLTVFLNSYYWELPLHLLEYLVVPFYVEMVVQLWRLVPIPFLLSHYKFQPNALQTLKWGNLFGAINIFIRYILFPSLHRMMSYDLIRYSHIVNRMICLFLLVKVVAEAKRRV